MPWALTLVCTYILPVTMIMMLCCITAGADCHALDSKGKHPFDYVQDHEEWINSGHFSDDIRALLKGIINVP